MTRVEVAIVGAGFAGLGMAMALQHEGRDDFVILERATSVGGTWRDNTYPGIACDVPSHLYGFADHSNAEWSGTYARGDEIRAYLERIVRTADLTRRLRLGTTMLASAWDAGLEAWRIETSTGTIIAGSLVLACGRLAEPSIPAIPGLETFPGPLFHSSRWDHTVDVTGARIAVVGTGASAVQLVPQLAHAASAVTLFQRTPAWIVPRGGRLYSDVERERFAANPAELEELRAALYAEGEARFASRSGDAEASREARTTALAHLAEQVTDPALRAALTPDYPFGCKRVLLSDDFYPALAAGSVTLEASALAAVDGQTLVAASGARYEVDALVLATGFESTRQPYAELIRGERGTLAAHWAEGMTSFGSTLVAGFPNLFVLNGPNATLSHNSAILMIEAQAEFAARIIASGSTPTRIPAEAERAYADEIAARSVGTPWLAAGCTSWYVDSRTGRVALLWPGSVDDFRARLARIDSRDDLNQIPPTTRDLSEERQ